jgi:N-acetylglucosaminyldiphosphoundecaprenol N-acetyl-beta-D-mannosaminyltransferase
VNVLGVRVDPVGTDGVLEEIERRIRTRAPAAALANVNVHAVNIAVREERFRTFLARSALVYCDGTGVRIAASLLGVSLPPCTVMTWWLWDLARWCAERGHTLFLLGGAEGVAAEAARRLARHAPGLKIAGVHHGYFRKAGGESAAVVDRINASGAGILLVCFGMPAQEYWWEDHRDRLAVPVTLFGGAALDYVSGRKSPGPRWLAPAGLAWLHRLIREPIRLGQRYVIGNPLFMIRVLGQLFREGRQG